MNKIYKFFSLIAFSTLFLNGCGSSGGGTIISTPVENIDTTPLKFGELTESEKKKWHFLDLVQDTVPGMSVDIAYNNIIKNKKGKTTIVAVIDSGIDIDHEDLDGVIWKNQDEVPNNGRDDDNNGYVDDVHGWNFLGDAYQEQMEYTRIVASNNTANPRYSEALKEYNEAVSRYTQIKSNIEQILNEIVAADKAIAQHLNKKVYTKEEVNNIKTQSESLGRSVAVIKYLYSLGYDSVEKGVSEINDQLNEVNDWLNYRLNKSFNGRKTGDNLDDITDVNYGNNNVRPVDKGETHGTMVAGIIAAERNNRVGMDGVANNVLIMPLRVVSNADEHDKDVALAIRYAVDNGAQIINGSFGKYYSPHADWVRDAIKYAADNNVLIVQSSGNDSYDADAKISFPNDLSANGTEIVDNFVSVGAIVPRYGSGLVADYSNYGQKNVDVFAPGSDIYTTDVKNNYDFVGGTSFASPNVSGIAALLLSQNPSLTAAQLKSIIMDSGIGLNIKVAVGGNPKNVKDFKTLSKSGKMVNLYNALLMADKLSPK